MTISLYIVEDYLLTRVGLKNALNKYKELHILGEFENAEDCISAMSTKQSDIILMDLGLPKMDGVQATRILKEKYPKTKIIMLTSYEKDEAVLAALTAGANAYCLKDSEEENLINIIKTVNDGALWLAPKIAQVPFHHLPSKKSSSVYSSKEKEESQIKLTGRELSILKLMKEGKSNPQIAKEIIISTHTVKAYVASILVKLEVSDRVQAVVKAMDLDLV